MAISDKLQDLIDIKQDIKTAIENKGVDLTGGGSQGETWLINEIPVGFGDTIWHSFDISFVSNNVSYSEISIQLLPESPFLNDNWIKYGNGYAFIDQVGDNRGWIEQAYRTVTFETAPTGDLLEWLQSNAVKQ